MASQDARLSKFEADFKQKQSEMNNKIDAVLNSITNPMAGALPSDTKDPKTPFLVGRGFLSTDTVIDCRKAKIADGEGITRSESYKPELSSDGVGTQIPYYARKDFLDCHLSGEWEISRDAEINPFKNVMVFRRMIEFLGALPINLKSNMCETGDLINNPINWDKPPKYGNGAWHAKIRLIDLDGEEFTKTLKSIPTTRKLFERESPREIINLDHFYDTSRVTSNLATRLINKKKRFMGRNPMFIFIAY
nr:hypothetical protein [Tanacetum cinerariifolium]